MYQPTITRQIPDKLHQPTISRQIPNKLRQPTISRQTPDKLRQPTISRQIPDKFRQPTISREIPDKQTAAGAQPPVEAVEEGLFVLDVEEGIAAVDDVKRLVGEVHLRGAGWFGRDVFEQGVGKVKSL